MPRQTTHPSAEELSAFSLGQLPPDDAATVERHISECEPCCETLLGLPAGDTFVERLQEARRLPTDLTVDQDGPPIDEPASPTDIPAALADHPRYEIVSLIGKGGMGDVYKARHRMMDRMVAIKIINRALVRKAEAVDRFHREVKTAARLSHPNIVTAHDAEQAGNVHFLVMEFVDGVDLARTVRDRGALPVGEACDYVRKAALGLQHAHECGMVHRDIKPHNLMVATDGTVKILDFGLATLAPEAVVEMGGREASGELTAVGSIMGTPDFISPEQATDAHQADIRSDIYSLGATLYFLLSGQAPFSEESIMHKLKSHAEVEPAPIENLQVDVPRELAEVIRRMMAKNPMERFQTPAEVADALAPLVDRHRTSPAAKAPKPKERRLRRPLRTWLGAALAACAMLLAGAIYVVTNTGTLVIESDDEHVEIAVRPLLHKSREGNKHSMAMQYRVRDTFTGSTVARLRSGAYIVDLKGRENEYELSQDQFILRRGGKVIVTVTRRDNATVRTERPAEKASTGITEVGRLEGHTAPITSIALSADGQLALSAGADKFSRVWDLRERQQVRFHPHFVEGGRTCVDIVPGRGLAVVGAHNGMLGLWELRTGQSMASYNWFDRAFRQVAASPRGDQLLFVGSENIASVNELRGALPAESFHLKHDQAVTAGAWSPDQSTIATATADRRVHFWRSDKRSIRLSTQPLPAPVEWLEFAPDGQSLVAGCADGRILRLDSGSGNLGGNLVADYRGHTGPVKSIRFLSDGRHFVSGSFDRTLRVWSVATGEEVARVETRTHVTHVLAVSPVGRFVVTGGGEYTDSSGRVVAENDYSMRVWQLPESVWPSQENEPLADGRHAASLGSRYADKANAPPAGDFAIRLWQLPQSVAPQIENIRTGAAHQNLVQWFELSRDGKRLFTASAGEITVRDAETFVVERTIDTEPQRTRTLAVSPDGALVANGGQDGHLEVWDWKAGKQLSDVNLGKGAIEYMEWSPDGRTVLLKCVSGDGYLEWNIERQRLDRTWESSGQAFTFSPDGRWLAAGARLSGSVKLFDAATGKLAKSLEHHARRDRVRALAFSPDSQFVLSGADDGLAKLWNVETGELLRTFEQGSNVHSGVFLPAGKRFLTSSKEGRLVVLWNIDSAQGVAVANDVETSEKGLELFPDGGKFITCHACFQLPAGPPRPGAIQLWRVPRALAQD